MGTCLFGRAEVVASGRQDRVAGVALGMAEAVSIHTRRYRYNARTSYLVVEERIKGGG